MAEKLLLLVLTSIALVYDLRFRRIPNWLLFFSLPAIALKLMAGEMNDVFWGLTVAGAIHLPAYLNGLLGGGDIKLALCSALYLGRAFFAAWIFTAFYAGIWGFFILFRGRGAVGFYDFSALLTTGKATSGQRFPYGASLTFGIWTVLLVG